jgi:hypothetical protein
VELIIAALLLILLVQLVWNMGEFWSHVWPALPQLHHGYYGVVLIALVAQPWAFWLGLALWVDDYVQHLIQLVKPSFLSPLHLAARYCVYLPLQWVRAKIA